MIYLSKNPSKKLTLHFLFVRFSKPFIWMCPDDLSQTREDKKRGIHGQFEIGKKMLVTIQGACERLSVSRSTLYRLISEGSLKRVYIKGAPRIPLSSLENLTEGM